MCLDAQKTRARFKGVMFARLVMRIIFPLLLFFHSTYSVADDSVACILRGIVLYTEAPDLNDRKHATIQVESVRKIHQFKMGSCEKYIGKEHSFSYDYRKYPFQIGNRAELVWININQEGEIPGQIRFGIKLLDEKET